MIIKKNLPFFNVVGDGVASLELPLGMTYHRIALELGGTFTKAMITNIVAKLNGKIFYEITGSRLDSINKFRGLTDSTHYLTIDFTEPNAKTLGGMNIGAIGTAEGVRSFTLEITIAGATAPTLDSYSMLTEPQSLGLIYGLISHPVTFSATGKYPVVLPHGVEAKHLIKRVYFFHTNMTTLEVKKNGLLVYEDMASAISEYLNEEYGNTWQSGLYVYNPVINRDMSRVLRTDNAQSLQFNVTVSAADTVNIYNNVLAGLDQF